MATSTKEARIPSVPTDAAIFYPEEDGKPMAVSDLHRRILIRTLLVLEAYFAQSPEVYISGDILMYYVEGDPRKSVSPDVLVAFGLGMKLRRSYLVWNEGKVPDFVMEFSSKNTYRKDLGEKMELYASLGIPNYFLYDAEGLYLPSPLMGFELVDGSYLPISADEYGGFHAGALGLDFYVSDVGLGIYDPAAGEWLQTPAESAADRAEIAEARAEEEAIARQRETTRAEIAEAHAETAEARAETAEARAEKEAARAEKASNAQEKTEAEAVQLREEIARLRARLHRNS